MKGRTDVRTYVRTDVDDVMAMKPNFLTSMGYHIFLTMVLRAQSSAKNRLQSKDLTHRQALTIVTKWSSWIVTWPSSKADVFLLAPLDEIQNL